MIFAILTAPFRRYDFFHLDDIAQLLQDRGARSLDAKNVEYFDAAVRVCALVINAIHADHGFQVDALCLQNPLHLISHVNAPVSLKAGLIVLQKEGPTDPPDSPQADEVQHCVLESAEEYIAWDRTHAIFFLV
jgi:hypothetical protein